MSQQSSTCEKPPAVKIFSGEIGTNIQNNSSFLALLIKETLMLKNENKEKISRMV
jgi:hypothetical protein